MLFSHPEIPLKDHLSEVGKNSKKIVESKSLDLTITEKDRFAQVAYLIGIAHDFGKATSFFQALIDGRNVRENTHHAPISSLFAFILVQDHCPDNEFLPILAYLAVRYHHSNLHSPERAFKLGASVRIQLDDLKENQHAELVDLYNELLPESIEFDEVFKKIETLIDEQVVTEEIHLNIYDTYLKSVLSLSDNQQIELFLCCNFLFSVLIDCDKKSAGNLDTDYFDGATEPIIDVGGFIEYKRSEEPDKFDPNIPINKLRNSFFKQTTGNKKLNSKQYLYTITAPTGIGKTFGAFGVANRLKHKIEQPARIIYALPFTSIIDQNYQELEEILEWNLGDDFRKNPTKYLLKHHYLSPMEIERDNADEQREKVKNYSQYYDDRVLNESWDAGHVVTTFVQLLETIVGFKNRQLKKFHNITNSILILDEVQNIPADYHLLIGKLLRVLAQRFNTYVILMTATQPTIFKNEESEELADPDRFFEKEELNRVKVKCLNKLNSVKVEYLVDHVSKKFDNNSILLVCNTKLSAHNIYKWLKKRFNTEAVCIYCLTTLLTPSDRLKQIDEIQEKLDANETVICVSTQLIEAGVDLSFPVVYRDIGPFDSVVQVAGRCNRNGELDSKGTLYLFKLETENSNPFRIYDSILLQYTGDTLEGANQYESSDFYQLGKKYFGLFNMKGVSKSYLRGIKNLNYSEHQQNRRKEKPVNEFELIEERPDQVELIVCTNPEVEQLVYQFEENRKRFKDAEAYSKERKVLMGEAFELRQKLSNYTITLFKDQLKPYSDAAEINERFDGKLQFIPNKYYEYGNIYDVKTGFITDPDSTTLLEII